MGNSTIQLSSRAIVHLALQLDNVTVGEMRAINGETVEIDIAGEAIPNVDYLNPVYVEYLFKREGVGRVRTPSLLRMTAQGDQSSQGGVKSRLNPQTQKRRT